MYIKRAVLLTGSTLKMPRTLDQILSTQRFFVVVVVVFIYFFLMNPQTNFEGRSIKVRT